MAESPHAQVSIISIAKHLGVSKTTVSAALAGDPAVRPATRERIERAAAELGYQRNLHARALRTHKSAIIGLIVGESLFQFNGPSYNAIDVTAEQAGYTVFQTASRKRPERERTLLEHFLGWSAEGVIIGLWSCAAEVYNTIAQRMPLLFLDTMPPGTRADLIGIDQYRGGYLAGQHLAQCGRRRILFLAPPPPIQQLAWVQDRLRGCTDALRVADVPDPVVITGITARSVDLSASQLAFAGVQHDGLQFDGIFAANDYLAMGAIDALTAMGLCVPDDVAVVGFDNTLDKVQADATLTTIEYPLWEIGVQGMALLLRRMRGEETGNPVHIQVPPQLVVRNTTR